MSKYLDYAQQAVETMMRKYHAADLPPKGHFHYHQGVFLSGVYKTFLLNHREDYFSYVKDWINSVFDAQGNILDYSHADLDDIQPGILLFPLLDRTSDEKYKKCIASVAKEVEDIPKCECGGFYHKVHDKGQMWLDGLYMACPFITEYGRRTDNKNLLGLVCKEIYLMRENTEDSATGLWYHAWDETRTAAWCDKKSGLSPEFWGRSIGWVPVALLGDLDSLPPEYSDRKFIEETYVKLITSVMKYQSADGRWYQVVNKGERSDNWLENSCSCLFANAIARGVKKGLLPFEDMSAARKAFDGVTTSLQTDGDDLLIGNVCIGTGVGDYKHYINRPCSINDLHGVGAFLLMCTALEEADTAI